MLLRIFFFLEEKLLPRHFRVSLCCLQFRSAVLVGLGKVAGLNGMICNRKLGVGCSRRWVLLRGFAFVFTPSRSCSRTDWVPAR